MKKTIYMMAAALSMVSLAACSGNQKSNGDKSYACGDRVERYSGILPAADADGVKYSLKLEFDDDHNYTDGDYDLLETYLEADTTSASGYKDLKSFKSEGDFDVMNKDGKKYLKLVQDVDDSAQGSNAGPMYFLVESDSTIVMVNSNLELAQDSTMNYTLKLEK